MSARPSSDERSEGASSPPLVTWSACAIANSIAHTIASSYKWLPRAGESAAGVQPPPPEGKPDGGEPEYTSEHLAKALIALKTCAASPPSVSRQTMSEAAASSDSETCTDISRAANPGRADQNIETKPAVETVSTQSTADRLKLSAQTTTEDLPALPPIDAAPSEPSRSARRSKVPVFRAEHLAGAPSSTSIHAASSQSKLVRHARSKIPQRLAPGPLAAAGAKCARLPNEQAADLPPCRLPCDEGAERADTLKIDDICKNLIDNIQIVENALDQLPAEGGVDLRAICEACHLAPAQDACTMSDDLQQDGHCQSETTQDDEEGRQLYEEQVYKAECDSDHIDSTTGDVDHVDHVDHVLKPAEAVPHPLSYNEESIQAAAYEANIFNIVQSQKINNILRMAMPYNNLLLPVFVTSPSWIMHTLEHELRHTLEKKRATAVYFCAANASIEQRLEQQLQQAASGQRRCRWHGGAVVGPQLIAQAQATWARPPFYYGAPHPATRCSE